MKGLTRKQQNILEFIEEFHFREGVPPTVYEIADHFNIKPATSFAHLRALQKKGYLNRTSKARSITLLKTHTLPHAPKILHIPILGRISAGQPLLSEENIEDTLKCDPAMLPWGLGTKELFALRVNGDSMKDAGIFDGDVVVARHQVTAELGQIVIALVDGESTIKYFHRHADKVELRPANPAFKPQIYTPENVRIQGILAALLRTY